MCGIAGAIGYSLERVRCGLASMHHRGPDDCGIMEIAEGVVMAHKRLSILDLSANGKQPMQTADGRLSVTFNGEIYNFPELKGQLAAKYAFSSSTDTEVLLHGYREWGISGLLSRIRGMFAFALYDNDRNTLYMARDRFGKKPLFYTFREGRIAYASSLPSLLNIVGHTPEIDPLALDEYLTFMCVPQDRTMFTGIRKLPPASLMTIREGQASIERYWDLSFKDKTDMSEADIIDEMDRLVRQAVAKRMISDVPLGAFLSGGVDSSLIVGVMSSLSQTPVTTITMGFAEERYDERRYARIVSERWGTRHFEETIEPDAAGILPELIFHTGEPLADCSMVPTYYVSRLARKHITVVLNGDGGDELFAGYARPMVEMMAQTYRRLLPPMIRKGMAGMFGAGGKPLFRTLSAAKQIVMAGGNTPKHAYVFDRALRSHRDELYTPQFMRSLNGYHPDRLYENIWDRSDGTDSIDRVLYGDAMTYLPDELLVKMDTMTMAHSLEARSPLLDTELAEFAARIPSRLKMKKLQSKYLLKRLAERYVPAEVLYRPKKGFNMPMSEWLRRGLRSVAEEVLFTERAYSRGYFQPAVIRNWWVEHQTGRADHGQKLWTLFVLELWFLMFVDGILQRSDTLMPAPIYH